jgi:hypothetical protein
LQFTGNAPVEVAKYNKKVLRCNACGHEFMRSKKITKWTNGARSNIILQKVTGTPWHRLADLQKLHGIAVAASTMWTQVQNVWNEVASYIYTALMDEASKSKMLCIDDTGAKILEVIAENQNLPEKQRKACHTTTICATRICANTKARSKILLYITAQKYSGQNVAPLLEARFKQIPDSKVVIVSDMLAANTPHISSDLQKNVIMSGCLVHARRKFFELLDFWPNECRYFIEEIAHIYNNEDRCIYMNDKDRLKYHQENSWVHMNNIYNKIESLFASKQVEPNSDLGKAMNYWLNHKKKLTTFLRLKGVVLDNNLSERALKRIIIQRKNSLFFYSRDSAEILSGMASIVATCKENNINAFAYLNWIQENWKLAQETPEHFLPWSYQAMQDQFKLAA